MAKKQVEAVEGDESEVKEVPRGGVEVNLDEPEADEEESVDEDPAPRAPSRRDKKNARFKEFEERAARAEAEAAQARRDAQTLEQRLGYLAQHVQSGGKPPPDPDELEIAAARKEQELLVREFQADTAAGKLTPEKQEQYRQKGYELRERENRAMYRHEFRKNAPTAQQQQQYQARQQFQTRYPDVAANQRAGTWVMARFQQRVTEGQPDDWSTMDRVVEEARGMGGRQGRTDETLQRKYAGNGPGASGGNGAPRGNVTLNAQDKDMADAAYPHLPPEKRYAHFAKKVLATRAAKAARG